jgi:hypothetical protein
VTHITLSVRRGARHRVSPTTSGEHGMEHLKRTTLQIGVVVVAADPPVGVTLVPLPPLPPLLRPPRLPPAPPAPLPPLRPALVSSNRSWAYTGENFISPTASKTNSLHNPTTTCKGTDHGSTPELNIYIQNIYIYIYIYQKNTIIYIYYTL